jgi:hypothetical protein
MLTEDQKAAMCEELNACHAYREQLSQYEYQAIQQYVNGKQQFLANRPEDEQEYFRAINPAYDLADIVAAILATPATEVAPTSTVQPQKPVKAVSRTPNARLRELALEDVQELFKHPILQSEGERAAALAILNIQNYLPGSPYKVEEWFATNVGAKVSRRLIAGSIKEIREEGELSQKAQQAADWVARWLEAKAK